MTTSEPDRASIYAPDRTVTDPDECYFYHTADIPGHGLVKGEWDLRGGEHQYLGGIGFAGKRVLELGPATGFLTTYMERQGADVVAYDLSEDFSWDVVPFAGMDYEQADLHRKSHLHRLNNGWWFNHRATESTAKAVYGTIYDIPAAIGEVDIATFASILLHLRDPFLALQSVASLVTDTIVVTDLFPTTDLHLVADIIDEPGPQGRETRPLEVSIEPKMVFLPQFWDQAYGDTWWLLSPSLVQRFLGVLGFEKTELKNLID